MKNSLVYIVMGVSGSGKSTVGVALAKALKIPFYDGDDFHTMANVQKMESGQPLNDEDRGPWLTLLAQRLRDWDQSGGAVLACSALKQEYRKTLQQYVPVNWVYLQGTAGLILQRMRARKGHYMKPEMLASQFAILEEPQDALRIDIETPIDQIVQEVLLTIRKVDKS
ncbi:MAG: gluconokinase [Bacteroidota bacterium]